MTIEKLKKIKEENLDVVKVRRLPPCRRQGGR